jgi:heme oxygenase
VSWQPRFGFWRPTLIAADLARDLADLQAEPLPEEEAAADADDAGLFGTLYVMEGSSLGARVIAKDASKLGLGDHYGARHLGRQHAALETWHAFLALLEDGDSLNLASVVDSANAVFDTARRAVLRVDHAASR